LILTLCLYGIVHLTGSCWKHYLFYWRCIRS